MIFRKAGALEASVIWLYPQMPPEKVPSASTEIENAGTGCEMLVASYFTEASVKS